MLWLQYLVLAGTNGVNRMVVNLQRSTFSPNVTYNSSLILAVSRGTTSCTHFAPYVDLATGELMAEVKNPTPFSLAKPLIPQSSFYGGECPMWPLLQLIVFGEGKCILVVIEEVHTCD